MCDVAYYALHILSSLAPVSTTDGNQNVYMYRM